MRSQLARADWIRAAQGLLREGGVQAVKLGALTRALGVTTGSFYHHFKDLDALLAALAEEYAKSSRRLRGALADLDPVERIRALLAVRAAGDVPALDRAMRAWAEADPRARAAVEQLDNAVLDFVFDAFTDLGFEPAEARMRARTAYAAGIGLAAMSPRWPVGDDEEDRAVALFVGAATPPR